MAILNVKDIFPWNKMEKRTVDGQSVVFIPKIYVMNTALASGKYAGRPAYFISGTKDDGYHCHPAFMQSGAEAPTGIEIGVYGAGKDSSGKATSTSWSNTWTSTSYNDIRTAAHTRNVAGGTDEQMGWHAYNIYEHHLIARLMLIEYESADLPTLLGGNRKATDVTYHGIEKVWGGNGWCEWLDGLAVTETTGSNAKCFINVFDMYGYVESINTPFAPPGKGWPVDFHREKGAKYDLGDLFIASETSEKESGGSCGDYQDLQVTGAGSFHTAHGTFDSSGPFSLSSDTLDTTIRYLGFRLARYC